MGKDNRLDQAPGDQRGKESARGDRHPLFGALKGFIRIPPGVDLTEPVHPDWGKVYERPARR
jgi:hypothetical protein